MARSLIALVASSLSLSACGITQPKIPDTQTLYGTEPQERILYRPQGQPASLLGKEVIQGTDGVARLSDELRPGCVIRSNQVPEAWSRAYSVRVEETAGGILSLPNIAELKAHYGEAVRVRVSIRNTQRLDGDIKGDCGTLVVLSVRVGTGESFVGSKSDVDTAASRAAATIGASGGYSQRRQTVEQFSWTEPQAWSFTYGSPNSTAAVHVTARMPTELADGEQYAITMRSDVKAWLLVYGYGPDGALFRLLPNMKFPVIEAAAGETRELPRLRAQLANPALPAHETLVLYAFDAPEYAQRFAMPAGSPTAEQMKQWEELLKVELAKVGQRHWERQEIHYRISPR